jgi:hypothetical protein
VNFVLLWFSDLNRLSLDRLFEPKQTVGFTS